MKKGILLALFSLALYSGAVAQRYAVIDMRYILDRMPDYKTAQENLDATAAQWQKDIDVMQQEVDKMYTDFEAERVMLSEELRKKREDQLYLKEKAVRDLQRKRFGFEGDLFKKRQELVKPVQDKVYDAIQKVATTKGYDVVFDKSSGVTMLYASTKLDVSDDVIKQLGYAPKSK
jgi:outer membrane protein